MDGRGPENFRRALRLGGEPWMRKGAAGTDGPPEVLVGQRSSEEGAWMGDGALECDPLVADFVAEVGAEIGVSVDGHPFVSARPMGAAASTHWH